MTVVSEHTAAEDRLVQPSTGLAAWIDDHLNPILVKELRQAVQGRVILGIFSMFLVTELLALGIFAVQATETAYSGFSETAGREAFIMLYGIMSFTCVLLLPAFVGTRLAMERSATGVDLLYVTTLKPWKIVAGKLQSGLLLALVIFSACMPFLTFTYFLRGLNLFTIFFSLFVTSLAVVGALQIVVLLALLPVQRSVQSILGLGGLFALFWIFVATIGINNQMMYDFIRPRLFWTMLAAATLVYVLGIGFVFTLCLALLSPPSANRALPVRAWLTFAWLATGVLAHGLAMYHADADPILVWGGFTGLVLAFYLPCAMSERDSWTYRVRRWIPRRPALRLPAILLFSGAFNGLLWVVALLGATGALAFLANPVVKLDNGEAYEEMAWLFGGFTLYSLCFSLTGAIIRRKLLWRWVSPIHTWAIAVLLFAALATLPMLALLMSGDSHPFRGDTWFLCLGNPAVMETKHAGDALVLLSLWALIASLANSRWFARQLGGFRPAETPPVPAFQRRVERVAPKLAAATTRPHEAAPTQAPDESEPAAAWPPAGDDD